MKRTLKATELQRNPRALENTTRNLLSLLALLVAGSGSLSAATVGATQLNQTDFAMSTTDFLQGKVPVVDRTYWNDGWVTDHNVAPNGGAARYTDAVAANFSPETGIQDTYGVWYDSWNSILINTWELPALGAGEKYQLNGVKIWNMDVGIAQSSYQAQVLVSSDNVTFTSLGSVFTVPRTAAPYSNVLSYAFTPGEVTDFKYLQVQITNTMDGGYEGWSPYIGEIDGAISVVPEPASLVLAALGGLWVATRRRRNYTALC